MVKALESVGCPYNISEKILPFIRKTLVQQFTEMMQTPYVIQSRMEGDSWVMKQREREYRTLVGLRNSIYFNYKAISLFEGKHMSCYTCKLTIYKMREQRKALKNIC